MCFIQTKSPCLFGISETSQCSFCKQSNETIEPLFCHCFVAKALWAVWATQGAFFGFPEKHLGI